MGNNWEFAVLTYAVFKLGAVLVRACLFLCSCCVWTVGIEV